MKHFSKSNKRNRKSLLSIALATLLTFSFNYSPISLISKEIKSASAYKSSALQTYYANPTTESESKIAAGKTIDALKSYFGESSNNFNILTYYNKRFISIFADHVHKFLTNSTTEAYKTAYQTFLDYKNYETLYDYYEADKSYIKTTYGAESFIEYVEYFVSHKTEWNISSSEKTSVEALIDAETQSNYKSHFYCRLANHINNEQLSVETIGGKFDGVADNATEDEFYTQSTSYLRVKEAIDNKIVETVAIYSYDGYTQNNNVAGILAENAPTSSEFYYNDSKYFSNNTPKVSYTNKNAVIAGQTFTDREIFYFGSSADIDMYDGYIDNRDFFTFAATSVLDSSLFQYREVQPGEDGYINANHKTYYKYSSIPYATTYEKYDVYVLDNSVTPNEQATYDSLFYKVITDEDLKNDKLDAQKMATETGKPLYDCYYYYNIPYSKTSNGNKYFKQLISSYSDATFTSYCNFFAPEGTSRLYLKVKVSQTYTVYIDKNENNGKTASDFLNEFPNYDYEIKDIDFSDNSINKDEYFKITSSYSSYTKSGYTLYFKKIKVFYNTLVTDESTYTGAYETTEIANIPYETSPRPSESYELNSFGRVIYVVTDDATITLNGKIYTTTVKQSSLDDEANRNVYVEVPESVYDSVYGDNEVTNKLYYKHKIENQKQVYIIDDSDNAADNEVYKNLYYKVITSKNYKENYSDYIEVKSTDKDYNKNFKLYYKLSSSVDNEEIYVQNELKDANAVFIVDDSLTSSDKTTYFLNMYTVISSSELNNNSDFYVLITENDPNYSPTYTKLYYKYNATKESGSVVKERVVYLYSSKSSDTYKTFYSTETNYVASDYQLILPGDENYVEGLELYYKRIRTEKYENSPVDTYYYFSNTSALTLKADSYYAISFYINTTGFYDEEKTLPIEASVYITDSSKVLSDISLEKISTNGKWVKYYTFIATDTLSQSSVTLSLYMGNKKSILGSNYDSEISSVTGSVLFDNIQVLTINQTDFTKRAVDDKVIETTEEHTNSDSDDKAKTTIDVIIANESINTNVYDYRTQSTLNMYNQLTWNGMFDFDNANLKNTFDNLSEIDETIDGYTSYEDIWQYYISRDVSGQGNNFKLEQYQDAYMSGDLSAEIVEESTIDKTIINAEEDDEEDEDEKESNDKDEDKDEKEDVLTIESTFNKNNKVLKLSNSNKIVSLGVVSNSFEIKQFEYYKLTVWIYSPDVNSSATLSVNSILKTASTPTYGSFITKSATFDACIEAYSTKPTHEYSWIPVYFYIESNMLQDQDCYLVLSADKNSTVYFDNITIENISSTAYTTVTSDSKDNTNYISLTPTSSVIANGVTNGYFNNIDLTKDFRNPDFSAPKTAKSWTVQTNSSSNVVSGIVSTNSKYTSLEKNFFKDHNNGAVPYSDGFNSSNSYNNIYAIYASPFKNGSIEGSTEKNIPTTNVYKIYSSAISLSASSTYEVAFDFYAGLDFEGTLVANIYYGSVATDKLISSISLTDEQLDSFNWESFKFFIQTSTSSASVYIEIGIENATGTCFFKDVSSKTTTKSLVELKNELINADENKADSKENLFEKESLNHYKFLNLANVNGSIHGSNKNEGTGAYDVKEYSNSLLNTKDYTVGKSGVAIATFYDEKETINTYSVTINKVTYYIGEITDEETSEKSYKLYKYSDCLEDDEVTEIDGQPVTVESLKKVVVGKEDNTTDYTSTTSSKTIYNYTFTEDVILNDVTIPAKELNNSYSENVTILANSYSTDFIELKPAYTSSLSKTSFYVLKIYVKTSEFAEEDFGLNINISSITTKWENVDTTEITGDAIDEDGFVCYQTLIKTSDASITSFGVTFSLGSSDVTGKGYAIIAGMELEKYADEDSFDHYASTVEDDEKTVKKYYKTSTTSSATDDKAEDEDSLSWATFFYIFSSLLLVLTLAIAMTAIFIKKHPIKLAKKVKNEHDQDTSSLIQTDGKKKVVDVKDSSKEEDDGNDGIV